MRAVEDAFTYRLVWALEAVRTRRMSFGWSPDTVAGGAAAAVETGVPQFMMAMLIRAGLPSRRAAMAAIEDAEPLFVTPAECGPGLNRRDYGQNRRRRLANTRHLRVMGTLPNRSSQRRHPEMVSRTLQAPTDTESSPPAGLYRILTDEGDARTWLATPTTSGSPSSGSQRLIPSPAYSRDGYRAKPGSWMLYASAAESCVGQLPTPKRERPRCGMPGSTTRSAHLSRMESEQPAATVATY
jgi:hypothetical protein